MSPKKRQTTTTTKPDANDEVVVETTEIVDEDAPPDPSPYELFDLAGRTESGKIHISRLNDLTGNYAMLKVLAPPVTWEDVARRYGGGSYRWEARVDGRYTAKGAFEIDLRAWPSAAGATMAGRHPYDFGGRALTETPESATMETVLDRLVSRMESIEARLSGSPPSQPVESPRSAFKDMMEMLVLLRQNETGGGAGEVLKILQSGIAIGEKGEGKAESGLASVAEAVLPKLLELMESRNAMMFERDKARGFRKPKRQRLEAAPRKETEPDSLIVNIQKIIGMASRGVDPAEGAAFAEKWLPAGILDMLVQLSPEDLLRQLAEFVPGETKFLRTEIALGWAKQFLDHLAEDEDEPDELPPEQEPIRIVENAEGNTASDGAKVTPSPPQPTT